MGTQARYPCFSPDGSHILFSTDEHVYILNADGSGLTQLTFGPGRYYGCGFSPNGQQIVYTDCTNWADKWEQFLCVMNVDGTEKRQLTCTGCVGQPVFTPDGQAIVYTYSAKGHSEDEVSEVYRLSIDGNGLTRLTYTPFEQGKLKHFNSDPVFSPEGEWIYFVTSFHDDKSEERDEVYRMRPDGTERQRVSHTGGHVTNFCISLDGRRLTFMTWIEGKNHERSRDFIWVMDADGDDQTMLFEDPYGETDLTSISPDGRWAAFCSNMSPNGYYPWDIIWTADIYLVNTGNGEVRRLTNTIWRNEYATFSPDGKQILFTSNRDIPSKPGAWDTVYPDCEGEGHGDLYMLTREQADW